MAFGGRPSFAPSIHTSHPQLKTKRIRQWCLDVTGVNRTAKKGHSHSLHFPHLPSYRRSVELRARHFVLPALFKATLPYGKVTLSQSKRVGLRFLVRSKAWACRPCLMVEALDAASRTGFFVRVCQRMFETWSRRHRHTHTSVRNNRQVSSSMQDLALVPVPVPGT